MPNNPGNCTSSEEQEMTYKEKMIKRKARLTRELSETNEVLAVFDESPDAEDLCKLFFKTCNRY